MSDRERLIEIIEQARAEAVSTIGSMNNGFAAWYADKLLAAGVAPVQGWIPVTERLPEPLVEVLILTQRAIGKSCVMVGQYSRLTELWYIGEYSTQAKVTHWMPLPDAHYPGWYAGLIKEIPAADVVPVVHSEWDYGDEPLEVDENGDVQAFCKRCGSGDVHAKRNINKVPYCWKCGAKMKEEQ